MEARLKRSGGQLSIRRGEEESYRPFKPCVEGSIPSGGTDEDVKRDITNVYPSIRWTAIQYVIGDFGYQVVSNMKLRKWGWYKYRRLMYENK